MIIRFIEKHVLSSVPVKYQSSTEDGMKLVDHNGAIEGFVAHLQRLTLDAAYLSGSPFRGY